MARLNVYLPDELARDARAAGLNVSGLTREAVRSELARRRASSWLERVRSLPPTGITHAEAMEALEGAKRDLERRGG